VARHIHQDASQDTLRSGSVPSTLPQLFISFSDSLPLQLPPNIGGHQAPTVARLEPFGAITRWVSRGRVARRGLRATELATGRRRRGRPLHVRRDIEVSVYDS